MTAGIEARVTLDGNFFRRRPGATIYDNVRDLMDALAAYGQQEARGEILAHRGAMPGWTGWTLDHVIGRTSSYAGRRWAVTAVVTASTGELGAADAIRTKAAASGIEARFHPFRRTAGRIRQARALITTNLTKGLE